MTSHPIPTTLEEAVDQLVAMLSTTDYHAVKALPLHHLGGRYHSSAGMQLRNEWHLWENTGPLNEWFRARGVWHADDKSGLLFDALWHRVNARPFDLDAEIARYVAHWKGYGQGFDGEPIPGFIPKSTRWLKCGEDGYCEEVEGPLT